MTRLWPEEAERNVLGAILAAASYDIEAGHRTLRRCQAAGLDAEHFGLASHGALYAELIEMRDANLPLDPVSVAARLDNQHADPRLVARLRLLVAEFPVISSAPHHARIVADAALRRWIEDRGAA